MRFDQNVDLARPGYYHIILQFHLEVGMQMQERVELSPSRTREDVTHAPSGVIPCSRAAVNNATIMIRLAGTCKTVALVSGIMLRSQRAPATSNRKCVPHFRLIAAVDRDCIVG